jgi:hypothetical protein
VTAFLSHGGPALSRRQPLLPESVSGTPGALANCRDIAVKETTMRRILLALAGYMIAAWWTSRTEAKREAQAQPPRRPRKAGRLQGDAGERRPA